MSTLRIVACWRKSARSKELEMITKKWIELFVALLLLMLVLLSAHGLWQYIGQETEHRIAHDRKVALQDRAFQALVSSSVVETVTVRTWGVQGVSYWWSHSDAAKMDYTIEEYEGAMRVLCPRTPFNLREGRQVRVITKVTTPRPTSLR